MRNCSLQCIVPVIFSHFSPTLSDISADEQVVHGEHVRSTSIFLTTGAQLLTVGAYYICFSPTQPISFVSFPSTVRKMINEKQFITVN